MARTEGLSDRHASICIDKILGPGLLHVGIAFEASVIMRLPSALDVFSLMASGMHEASLTLQRLGDKDLGSLGINRFPCLPLLSEPHHDESLYSTIESKLSQWLLCVNGPLLSHGCSVMSISTPSEARSLGAP